MVNPEPADERAPTVVPQTDAMFATLYAQLRRLAHRQMACEGQGLQLGATTLLHDAYLDLSKRDALAFADESRFIAYAARVMRSLVIDHVREVGAQKRGGEFHLTTLDTRIAEEVSQPELLSDVDAALDELATLDPKLAEVVDLKFFCGFTLAEIAVIQNVSERTVQRMWEKARALLYSALRAGPPN